MKSIFWGKVDARPDFLGKKECQTLHGCGGCFTYRMSIFVTKIGIQFLKKHSYAIVIVVIQLNPKFLYKTQLSAI